MRDEDSTVSKNSHGVQGGSRAKPRRLSMAPSAARHAVAAQPPPLQRPASIPPRSAITVTQTHTQPNPTSAEPRPQSEPDSTPSTGKCASPKEAISSGISSSSSLMNSPRSQSSNGVEPITIDTPSADCLERRA